MEIHFTKTATAMATAKMRSKVRTVFAVASLTSTTLEPLPRKKVRKAKIERRLHELVLKKLNSVLEGRRVDTLRFRFKKIEGRSNVPPDRKKEKQHQRPIKERFLQKREARLMDSLAGSSFLSKYPPFDISRLWHVGDW
ncbi:hypothetical protein HZH66_002820 [Vespula vulgaris]|uniref:Uncharacterized protein n=1 Tax=Vespula vulgaris TaxID=7454 RepID=A0A834KKB7_VESVU|nr:hypothetical protein HZH66_002820 [Vespula vulgaris]